MTPSEFAQYIDHTLLKPEATVQQILQLCEEALQWGFYAVCVQPCRVSLAAERLAKTSVKVASVVGFPHGANTTFIKAAEAARAVNDGAHEIDMVMNLGWAMQSDWQSVEDDIAEVVRQAQPALVKVILETGLLSEPQIISACKVAEAAGAAFVKTSTGFHPSGAEVKIVELMRRTVSPRVQVKASGGIRDWDTALAMIQAGAARLGMSGAVLILEGQTSDGY